MHIAGQLPEVRLVRTDIHLLIGIPTGEKNWPTAPAEQISNHSVWVRVGGY
jgi:hypothetical protein